MTKLYNEVENTSVTNKKKVGIFTLTHALNYGAFFQMFSMTKYMESLGYQVTVYDCESSIKYRILRYFSYNISRQISKLILRLKYLESGKSINIKKYQNEFMEIAIFGSDEIWNFENRSFEKSPFYYGYVNSQKKIAYAPSIGFCSEEVILSHNEFVVGIKGLDSVFPRDSKTKLCCEKIVNQNLSEVVDPTVLYYDWDNHAEEVGALADSEYIVYYGYYASDNNINLITRFANERNYKIISAGFTRHSWCDENLLLSPFQFLSLIKNSKGVFTNTFHGFLMTILLEAPLCFFAESSKLLDIVSKLEMENLNLVSSDSVEDIDTALEQDVKARKAKLKEMRDFSEAKLKTALK